MLNDFLVLGQIPGTKIQITFTEMLLGLALIGLFIAYKSKSWRNWYLIFRFSRELPAANIDQQLSLQFLELVLK